jgi:uncharacterized protein (DUF1330 family)
MGFCRLAKGVVMSAYLVAFVTATHGLDWVSEYVTHVPTIVRHYGGEYLGVPKIVPNAVECVEGSAAAPDGSAVLRFPSMGDVKRFLESPDYAPYRTARVAATESNFFAFENDPDAPQFKGA